MSEETAPAAVPATVDETPPAAEAEAPKPDAVATALGVCWGLDTNTKITLARAKAIAAARYRGEPFRFVLRYGPLPGNNPAGDLDAKELELLLDVAKVAVGVVQHCRAGRIDPGTKKDIGWICSGDQGQADGEHLAAFAKEIGYATGSCLLKDSENVANPGADAMRCVNRWAMPIFDGGFLPSNYIGFKPGLSPDEQAALPQIHRYMLGLGSGGVAGSGACATQFPTVKAGTLEGLDFDLDPVHGYLDAWGRSLVFMARPSP